MCVFVGEKSQCPGFRDQYFGFEPNFWAKLGKIKNVTLINALIGNNFWNESISCHDIFKYF